MKTPLRVLVVEDSPNDAELALLELRRGGYEPQSQRVETPEAMAAALAGGQWDIILCDYSMPQFSAPAALEMLKGSALDIPFIVVSGAIGEDTAVELMRAGAHDYVMKNNLARLAPAVSRELAEAEHRRKRRKAEQELQASQVRYSTLFAAVTDAIYVHHITDDGRPGKLIDVNDVAGEMLGYTRDELLKMGIGNIDAPESTVDVHHIIHELQEGRDVLFEQTHVAKDGRRIPVEVHAQIFMFRDRLAILSVVRDITERKRAETRIHRLSSVVEQSTEGMAITDLDGNLVFVNLAWARMHGYESGDELLGRNLSIFHSQEQVDREVVPFNRKVMEQGHHAGEVGHMRKDGTTFPALMVTTLLRDDQGEPVALAGIAKDITERKRAEEEIEDLAKFPSEDPDPVLRISADGTVVYANAASEGLLAAWGSGVGRPAPDVWRDRVSWSLDDGTAWQEALAHEGRMFSFSGVPVPPAGYVNLYGRDVTDRERAEDELRLLSSRQEAILASVPDIIMEVDDRKVYTWANQAGLEFFGPDVLGKEADCYFEGRQDTYDVVQPLFAGSEEVAYVESWQRRRDGAKRLLAWWCRVLKDSRGHVTGALSTARDITERKLAEQALRDSEERYRQVVSSTTDAVMVFDAKTRKFIEVNQACTTLYGYSREEFLEMKQDDITAELAESDATIRQTVAGKLHRIPLRYHRKKDGTVFPVEISTSAFVLAGRQVACGVIRDITERKQMEAERARLAGQFNQAQKMEAVGQLAGGVAHDFRNQLTVIRGLVETLLRRSMVTDEGRGRAERILKAADRSAKLTAQLLAFSRKEVLEPQVTDLSDLVADLGKSLPQMIGEDIRLSITRSTRACHANVDPNLLQQAIVNLAINARDAMPNGGELIIETDVVDLDSASARRLPGAKPGRFCALLVKDSGLGMPEAVQKRIFEPFFTTKEVGRGTGLGLSMVYGFVKQSGGYVDCRSKPGKGTRLTLLFPWTADAAAPSETPPGPQYVPGGSETLLVVEDEPSVRASLVESLQEGGYRVLVAETGRDALVLARRHDGPIHMLVTDVIMPDMNGPELADRIRTSRPDMADLFVSGYAQGDLSRRGAGSVQRNLLTKPFTHDQLLRRVRAAIDSTGRLQRAAPKGPTEHS